MSTFECPTCRRTFTVETKEEAVYRPFCSHRCKMVDLGRWLDGSYALSEPSRSEQTKKAGEDTDV